MSVEVWPPLSPEQLKVEEDQSQRRELEWLLDELYETLKNLKHGLEDCYALLAPVEPGSTLAVSTPRNELVKGYITRVGTRITKGTLSLKMRTLPQQNFAIDPEKPIYIAPLSTLHTLLTHSIDLLTLTLGYTYPPPPTTSASSPQRPPPSPTSSTATFIAAQLRLLSQSLAEAASLLKGPQPLTTSDATWVSRSCSPSHFQPPPGENLSIHWGVQDSSLVLWIRALEPADAPVNFGMKFALAIGTARRLEHDEADQTFTYTYPEGTQGRMEGSREGGSGGSGGGHNNEGGGGPQGYKKSRGDRNDEVQVLVREKVRVESADPSLLSLSAKLTALANTLSITRKNLAAVMDEEIDD